MEKRNITTAKNNYLFINETSGTRNGFKHVTTLFINDYNAIKVSCYCLNRTWESYRYQSSMIKAVYSLMENRRDYLKNSFKTENNFKKMTASRSEILEGIYNNDALLMEYNSILKELR